MLFNLFQDLEIIVLLLVQAEVQWTLYRQLPLATFKSTLRLAQTEI